MGGWCSFEATQSLVLRPCIPAGWLPVPGTFLPWSHRGDCRLESGLTFSESRVSAGQVSLLSSHPSTLEGENHLTDRQPALLTSYPGGQSGVWRGWGLVPHMLLDLHEAVPARPSGLFPSRHEKEEQGEDRARVGPEGAAQGTHGHRGGACLPEHQGLGMVGHSSTWPSSLLPRAWLEA